MLFSWWFQGKSVILAASNIKYKGVEENRYKLTEDNAAAGMVAEPTPVVRPSLSVQEMRHCLMDAIYSSKDVDKLYSCLVILKGKPATEYRSKYRVKTEQNFLQSCHNSHLGMKQNILICRILIIGSINIRNLQEQLKQYQNGCN